LYTRISAQQAIHKNSQHHPHLSQSSPVPSNPISTNLNYKYTFFKIPLTLMAPLLSVLAMNCGLFHLIALPSSSVRSRSQSGRASFLLHLAPFPTMNSSLGSGGRFLLTRFTAGCKFTVLKPSFFLVLASVRDLSSFWEREVKGGVAGRVGRVDTSICKSDSFMKFGIYFFIITIP